MRQVKQNKLEEQDVSDDADDGGQDPLAIAKQQVFMCERAAPAHLFPILHADAKYPARLLPI
ncbi:hypothetical protein D3C81_1967200 [compost metagenome]